MIPEDIFQIERTLAARVAANLRAAGAGDEQTVRPRLDDADFAQDAQGVELPRLSVETSMFTRASGQMAWTLQGVAFYNHFRGQVVVEINTPRAGGAARHHGWIGLIRRQLNLAAVPDLSPYDLLDIEEGAGSFALVKDGERDRSRLVFNLQLAIPSGVVNYAATQPLPPIATT
jgi:hypothetical protein